jgi:tetratricopeptide (TPR) repeat protein
MRKFGFLIFAGVSLFIDVSTHGARADNVNQSKVHPPAAVGSLGPVDRRSAADVPADFLSPVEASALTRLCLHLTETSVTRSSIRNQRTVALALAAVAQSAAEGNALSEQALALLKADKVDVAVAALRVDATALAQNGDTAIAGTDPKEAAAAWRVLGAFASLIDENEAFAAYEKAVALDPQDVLSQFWVGDRQVDLDDMANAKQSLQRALVLADRDASGLLAVWVREDLAAVALQTGELDVAFSTYREFRQLVEEHADADPGSAIWRMQCALAFTQEGYIDLARSDLDAASRASQQAFAIVSALAASNGRDPALQRHLAFAYANLGKAQLARGDKDGALLSYKKAVDLAERAAAALPTNLGRMVDLSHAYHRLGVAQGNSLEAIASLEKAIALAGRAAALRLDDLVLRRDRKGLYERLGDVRLALGDLQPAEDAYVAEVAVTNNLIGIDTIDKSDWQRALAGTLNKLGGVQLRLGDTDAAFASFDGGLKTLEGLEVDNPFDTALQDARFIGTIGKGEVFHKTGDFPAALTAYNDALAQCSRMAQAHEGNRTIRENYALTAGRVGDVDAELKRFAEAETSYRKELAAWDKLAKDEPGNVEWRRSRALSYEKIGEAKRGQRDLDSAADANRTAHEIFAKLAQSDPANRQWQHDLSVASAQFGKIEMERSDFAAAVVAFTETQTLLRRIADAHPDDAGDQHDLSKAYSLLATGLFRKGEQQKALSVLKEGQAWMKHVAASAPDSDTFREDLDRFAEEIAKVDRSVRRDGT